jgi:hypothetical protein
MSLSKIKCIYTPFLPYGNLGGLKMLYREEEEEEWIENDEWEEEED